MLPFFSTGRHVDFDVATHASQQGSARRSYHHLLLIIRYATTSTKLSQNSYVQA